MADTTKIQWTDATWNPWQGCRKVSPGCKFCYMYRDKSKYGQDPVNVHRSSDKTFNKPLSWKLGGDIKRVFTCSWSDFFIEEADEWRDDAWEIIRSTPWLNYQILTKRPERIAKCLPDDWGSGYGNVWLGVSAENQELLNHRVNILAEVPGYIIRWVSAEPLLGELDITIVPYMHQINWVVVGGESGNETGPYRYRPMEIEWAEKIVADCDQLEIGVFVKQLGTYLSKKMKLKNRAGGDIEEFPLALQVRQFPVMPLPF